MHNRIINKLKSNSGASLVLVMVLFLLCVMVSSVIVSAASSGATRNVNRTGQQQGYLAISSALELLMAEMPKAGDEYEAEEETLNYACNNKDSEFTEGGTTYYRFENRVEEQSGHSTYYYDIRLKKSLAHSDVLSPTPTTNLTTTSLIKNLIKDACNSVYQSGGAYVKTFPISVDDSEGRIPEIMCTFTMATDYDIQVELYFAAGSAYSAHGAVIRMDGKTVVANSGSTQLKCTHDIQYYKNRGGYGSQGWKNKNDYEFSGTKTTKTTTVTWENLRYERRD